MVNYRRSPWTSVVYVWLFCGRPSDAFSLARSDRKLGTAIFSFNQQQSSYNNNDSYNDNNSYTNNGGYYNNNNNNNSNNNNGYGNDSGRERFKMVKQFNGDYKTVPLDEYYERTTRRNNERESIASEYGILRATRGANPYLTSPAREMISKQWDWQRPPPPDMKPRFRYVRTFSGDVKTVREDENPYLDGRVVKNQYGRVDGTGYVPDMGPESASMLRYASSRRRPDYGEPPRGPPRYPQQDLPFPPPPPPPLSTRPSRQDRRREYDVRRRELDPRFVGDEFRREMRKYRRDDFDDYRDEGENFGFDARRDRKGPLETLAKEAEKVIKSVTSVGGPYSRQERRQRKRDMGYLRRAATGRDMMYPPVPPPAQDMRYDNYYRGGGDRSSDNRDGNTAGSFASSKAVRSFEQQQGSGYYGPRPPYQSRQYDGYRYPGGGDYQNPPSRSEQGRRW